MNRTVRPAPVLPASVRAPIGVAAVVAALVVAALGALYAAGGSLGRLDEWGEPGQQGVRPPLRYLALAIDFCGEPIGAAVLLAAVVAGCLVLRRPRAALLGVAGAGSAVAVTTLLKPVVGRTIHGEHLSFPSGHTALLTAFALVCGLVAVEALRAGRRTGVLVLLAVAGTAGVAMAWAQVALGAHHLTDTVGGFCAAVAVVPVAAWLVDLLADHVSLITSR